MTRTETEIMLVEDDRIFGLLQERLLRMEAAGIPVAVFENGRRALDHILTSGPGVDFVIFLDINMPVMNGWEFLKEVQNLSAETRIRVAMVTSSVNQLDRTTAFSFPQVVAYFEKPLQLAQVREFLDSLEISAGDDRMGGKRIPKKRFRGGRGGN